MMLLAMLILMLVLGGLFLGLVASIVVACVRKSWKLALGILAGTWGVTIIVGASLLLLVTYLYRPYDPTSEPELKQAYAADFGQCPPAGITVLKARQVIVFDSGAQWLLLKATPEEIQRYIAMGFKAPNYINRDFLGNKGANAPTWWQPPTSHLELYQNQNWSKAGGWTSSQAWIGVDRSQGLIWFLASKID